MVIDLSNVVKEIMKKMIPMTLLIMLITTMMLVIVIMGKMTKMILY